MQITEQSAPKAFATVAVAHGIARPGQAITWVAIVPIIQALFTLFQNCFGSGIGSAEARKQRAQRRIVKMSRSRKRRRRDRAEEYLQNAVAQAKPDMTKSECNVMAAEIVEDWRERPDEDWQELFAEVDAHEQASS